MTLMLRFYGTEMLLTIVASGLDALGVIKY